jgi:hypothetical protein
MYECESELRCKGQEGGGGGRNRNGCGRCKFRRIGVADFELVWFLLLGLECSGGKGGQSIAYKEAATHVFSSKVSRFI